MTEAADRGAVQRAGGEARGTGPGAGEQVPLDLVPGAQVAVSSGCCIIMYLTS